MHAMVMCVYCIPYSISILSTIMLMKHFTLTTCCFCKASSFAPTPPTLCTKTLARRHFFLATSSFSALLPSVLANGVCPSSSSTLEASSFNAAQTSSLSPSVHSTDMSLQIGYLNARDAAALDADLMSTPGFSLEQLMELAGLAVAEAVYQVSAENDGRERKKRVLVVCGPGNNGGDGLVAARHLVHFGLDCTIVYPKPSSKPHFVNLVKQCQDMNIHVLPAIPSEENLDQNKYDIIVDAIFGFSFDSKSTIREPFATVISKMIQLQKEQNATLISVDVPSGWDVDGGDLTGLNFHPDVLISLTAPKMSANKFEGRHFVGGRFLPPAIAEKYGVQMYPYPGLRHCMEVTFVLGSSAESPKDSRFKAEVMEEGDWAVQYQTYLDSAEAYVKEQETHVKEASVRKVLEGEDWALQYAQYCMEKENKFLSSYQNKN